MAESQYDGTANRDDILFSNAIVGVAGLGTIGEPISTLIAKDGIKYIFLLDMGKYEVRNLARSEHAREEFLGEWKAVLLSRELEKSNPDVRIVPLCQNVFDLGDEWVRHSNVMLAALDNAWARVQINRQCRAAGVPLVDTGIGGDGTHHGDGVVRVWTPDGPCLECDMTPTDYKHYRESHPCDKEVAEEGAKSKMAPVAAVRTAGTAVEQAELSISKKEPHFKGSLIYFTETHITSHQCPPINEECVGHQFYFPFLFLDFDENTTSKELARMAAEKLDTAPEEFTIHHKRRIVATSTVCGKCQDVQGTLDMKKHVEEDRGDPCRICGGPLTGLGDFEIPPSEHPMSFFEIGRFSHVTLFFKDYSAQYEVVSCKCETREAFISEFLDMRERVAG